MQRFYSLPVGVMAANSGLGGARLLRRPTAVFIGSLLR